VTGGEGLALLRARVASIAGLLPRVPEALAAAPDAALALASSRRLIASGVGLSEGPARALVALAREEGRDARFVPLSAFARAEPPGGRDAQLVLFSQGLSPNARMALAHAGAYAAPPVLVTSVARAPAGVLALRLPPAAEDRLLLRVVGPAVATYAVACVVAPELAARHGAAVAAAYARGGQDGDDRRGCGDGRVELACLTLAAAPTRPVAFVTAAACDPELLFGLRWKVLEALRVNDPPVWDVLQIAHGPVQSFWDAPLTLIALERAGDVAGDALVDRLAGALAERHALIRLRARLPGALALFEWDAALDHALLEALARAALPLDTWAGGPVDAALYAVDRAPGRAGEPE